MESYEKRSDEAESQAERLTDEGERIDRLIEETKSDVQSKEGQLPGVADDDVQASLVDPEEEADEGEEPNTTSAD